MNKLTFKTNINCNGCLSKVQPVLDQEKKITEWAVDLQSDDRLLTVKTSDMSAEEVQSTVAKAGFEANAVSH
jgi:copper chaperone CopZ